MIILCPYLDCGLTYEIQEEAYSRISKCSHCGRLGTARTVEVWEKIQRDALAKQGTKVESEIVPQNMSAIIEDVRSLYNVGSIFRTADASGIKQLYLCGITGCPPRKEIAKTSLGAEDHVAWEYFLHPLQIIPALKKKGITVVALERTESSLSLIDVVREKGLSKPLSFVVGNEVSGISPEVLANCDFTCHLPMRGFKESLNVSVAFGAAAYLINAFL